VIGGAGALQSLFELELVSLAPNVQARVARSTTMTMGPDTLARIVGTARPSMNGRAEALPVPDDRGTFSRDLRE
jgi:hypothetical protein